MPLGTFQPPASVRGSSFKPQENHGKPLIVVPRKFLEKHVSKQYPTPTDKVAVDVVDLTTGQVYLSVLWGSKAVVDKLHYAMNQGNTDVPLPVQIVKVHPDGGGNDYYTVEPLDGKALELATAWDAKNPTRIADERAKAEAQAQADEQQANGQAAAQPSAPLQGLGSQSSTPAAAPAAESGGAGAGVSDADLEAMIKDLG